MRLRCHVGRVSDGVAAAGWEGETRREEARFWKKERRKGAAAVELWLRKRTTSTVLR